MVDPIQHRLEAGDKRTKVGDQPNQEQDETQLDPGELDRYAYSVGLQIDAVISNDKGAKATMQHDSEGKKVVLSFADLFILGVKKDAFAWGEAGDYYDTVVRKRQLKMPPFEVQVRNFESYIEEHPWVQEFLSVI
ncbi:MAG: hypothetical protein WCC10_08505 [Tumebacillaceae bacterium]